MLNIYSQKIFIPNIILHDVVQLVCLKLGFTVSKLPNRIAIGHPSKKKKETKTEFRLGTRKRFTEMTNHVNRPVIVRCLMGSFYMPLRFMFIWTTIYNSHVQKDAGQKRHFHILDIEYFYHKFNGCLPIV